MGQTLAFPVHPAWKTGMHGPMPAHQRMPWKPVPPLPHNPDLDVAADLGQVGPGTVKAVTLGALLLPTTLAAATAYVGFRLGSKDEGIPSIVGYIVGALGGITALMGILAMLGVAVTPLNFMQPPPPMVQQPTTTTTAA
jgi:hypothetical protein